MISKYEFEQMLEEPDVMNSLAQLDINEQHAKLLGKEVI
jgi:hypothetical protein